MTPTRILRCLAAGVLCTVGSVPLAAADEPASPTAPSAPAADAESPAATVTDSLVVTAIRGGDEAPVSRTRLERAALARLDHGQDLPSLLTTTPSVTAYADAGVGGAGYSYFSLRGIGQNRINVTLDGVPLNDPEENWVYFADTQDLLASVDSLEVQRGVGTSSVGSASFAGALSLASRNPPERFGGQVVLGTGSYGAHQGAVGVDSGRLFGSDGNGLTLSARLAVADGDGYREHSGARQDTAFLAAAWQGERTLWRLTALSGRLRSHLAYLAADEATLDENPRANPLDPAERDDFTRDLVSLQVTHVVSSTTSLAFTAARNSADGWFRVWADPGVNSELDQYGLDWESWTGMANLSHATTGLTVDAGIQAGDFTSHHLLDSHLERPATASRERLYRNQGSKRDVAGFVKLGVDRGRWHLFADGQLRRARFGFDGSQPIADASWTFFNPKVGARWAWTDRLGLYASLGRAQREPARSDIFAGEDDPTLPYDPRAVRPERVDDLELGATWQTARAALTVNLFAMRFHDEIALTGELSAIGLPLRRNVDRSSRRGLELDGRWRPAAGWELALAASFIRARIATWTQALDVYGADGSYLGSEVRTFHDVPALLTPEILLQPTVAWAATPWLDLSLAGRYVGASHLDNTGDDRFRAPAFTDLGLGARIRLPWALPGGSTQLTLAVDNLLDAEDQYPSGYSYPFLVDGGDGGAPTLDGIRYFYPLAGRHATLRLEVAF
jgi:iron complex outermembrane receptor protein